MTDALPFDEPDDGGLEVEDRFSMVPEWLLDSDVGDKAVRLYALLLRYGNTSGARMPGRGLLARRLRCSKSTIDRAVKELEQLGALRVQRDTSTTTQRRIERRGFNNNRYLLRTSNPQRDGRREPPLQRGVAAPVRLGGSRTSAARGSRMDGARGSRISAATCTERVFTESKSPTPPPPPAADGAGTARPAPPRREEAEGWRAVFPNREVLEEACAQLRTIRRELDQPTKRWTTHAVRQAIGRALDAGYEPGDVAAALVAVARDRTTELPGRLAQPGPWWDVTEAAELDRARTAKAAQTAAEQRARAAARAACSCVDGWLEDDDGRARRCPTCRPGATTIRSTA